MSFGITLAEVSVTGSVNQSIGTWNDSGVLVKNNKFSALGDRNLASGDSLITFAGSEDLGEGLKASFKFEPRVNISGADSSTPGLFGQNREAWIGLSGAFGTVHLGNNYTPLFLKSVAAYDPNGSTNMPGYLVSNVTTFNANNSIDYTAPKFVEGLDVQLNKNSGRTATIKAAATGDSDAGDAFGWGVSYNVSGFSAGLAGETTKVDNNPNDTKKTGYGVSYDFGIAKVAFQGVEQKLGTISLKTYGYGVTVPVGAVTLKVGLSNLNNNSGNDFDAYQVGVNYALSKRTSAYLLMSQYKNTTSGNKINANALGVVHNF